MNLGKCSITLVELTSAITGIERAWDMGIRDLTVQLDSLCAVNLFSGAGNLDHQYASIVSRFRNLLQRDWKLEVVHIFREGNCLSDCLANKGHSKEFGIHSIELSNSSLQHWGPMTGLEGRFLTIF
ncbi:Putative ribonuclease H protein At1g65750 [Linum perenne]